MGVKNKMFESIMKFFKKLNKTEKEETTNSKDAAKERLHLVLMQDRANVSADFLELMKQEIIEVIKKYIDVDEKEIDVRLTNRDNEDGTNGAPALYANIPIINIKNDTKKINLEQEKNDKPENSKDKGQEEKEENKEKIQESNIIEQEEKKETEKEINEEDKKEIERGTSKEQQEKDKTEEVVQK